MKKTDHKILWITRNAVLALMAAVLVFFIAVMCGAALDLWAIQSTVPVHPDSVYQIWAPFHEVSLKLNKILVEPNQKFYTNILC